MTGAIEKITIVGMGEDGTTGLGANAIEAFKRAGIIIASKRLTPLLPASQAEMVAWPSPFDPMIDQLKAWRSRRVVIAASGDPMWFGVGAMLVEHFTPDELSIIPAPSAFSLAAAKMGWPLQDIETISLHGRPVSAIERLIQPRARILALTSGGGTVHAVAERLCDRCMGQSLLTALEHLSGPQERCTPFRAETVPGTAFTSLLTLSIECRASPGAVLMPALPGLPDDVFAHDGQLTKREVRAATIAALSPTPGALLWDIGAGCGSIAIEWMRSVRSARAIAFERDRARIALIAENMDKLGTPDLEIIEGSAPGALSGADNPDAVFVGGAVSDPGVIDAAWRALKSGGRIVANAVTLDGETALARRQADHGGELMRLDVSHLDYVGARRVMRPRIAVTQWRTRKS